MGTEEKLTVFLLYEEREFGNYGSYGPSYARGVFLSKELAEAENEKYGQWFLIREIPVNTIFEWE